MDRKEGERKFDDVLTELGEFGRYQIRIYLLMCLFIFFCSWHFMVFIFLSGKPDHWCKIPEWESVDCASYGFNTSRECDLGKREVGIPWNYSDDTSMQKVYSSCGRYDTSDIDFSPDLDLQGSNELSCDAGWVYDNPTIMRMTLQQSFNLVCGKEYYASLAHSLFFAGVALGCVLMGMFSDRFGRHRALFVSFTAMTMIGIALAFSVNMVMFTVLKTLAGIVLVGVVQNAFIIANEMIGPSKRAISGNVIWVCYSLGWLILAPIAFYVRNWRHLQFLVSVVPSVLLIIYVLVPESPRWLLSQGRVKEATKIVRKLAKVNKADVKLETFNMDNVVADVKSDAEDQGVIELFRRPRLRLYTLNIMFQLCANTMVYYGVTIGVGSFGVNLYLAFAISACMELPASFIVVYPIERWGRRPVYIFFMVVCGVTILSTIFIPLGIARTSVAMIGKLSITSSFCIIYLFACEILPTPVRASALGMCTMFSSCANIFTPSILLLSKMWSPMPLVIFGSLAAIGAAFATFLPETRGKKIPETMDEGESLGRRSSSSKVNIRKLDNTMYSQIENETTERLEKDIAWSEIGTPV